MPTPHQHGLSAIVTSDPYIGAVLAADPSTSTPNARADNTLSIVMNIARNPTTPPTVLHTLATTGHLMITAAVAANPNTRPDDLRTLWTSPWPRTREFTAANPNTPADIIHTASTHRKHHHQMRGTEKPEPSPTRHHTPRTLTSPRDPSRSTLPTNHRTAPLHQHPARTRTYACQATDRLRIPRMAGEPRHRPTQPAHHHGGQPPHHRIHTTQPANTAAWTTVSHHSVTTPPCLPRTAHTSERGTSRPAPRITYPVRLSNSRHTPHPSVHEEPRSPVTDHSVGAIYELS